MNEQDKIEEDAELAAQQYINLKYSMGERVNENRIRKRALVEKWKPRIDPSWEFEE
jgi:hypothetical protein